MGFRTDRNWVSDETLVMEFITSRVCCPLNERRPSPALASTPRIEDLTIAPIKGAASLRILLVEDCPVQQLLSAALLLNLGIQPQLASDGVVAVLLAGEQQFDLILMDLQMEILDGLTATKRIRQAEHRRGVPAVPVIAHTADPVPADKSHWATHGISAYLPKPCLLAELLACLKKWCGTAPAAWPKTGRFVNNSHPPLLPRIS